MTGQILFVWYVTYDVNIEIGHIAGIGQISL